MNRFVASLAVFVACASSVRGAHAEEPRVSEARRHHRALDYEQCLDSLRAPPAPSATAEERADAEVLEGVCNFELGRTAIASEHFKQGLRVNPRAMLPPYSSPKMVEAFAAASTAVQAEHRAPPAAAAPAPAPVAAALAPAPAPDAQRRRTSPPLATWVFGAGAVVAGGIGTAAYVSARSEEGDANRARFESDAYALGDRARSSMTIANVALGSALVLAGAALVVWVVDAR